MYFQPLVSIRGMVNISRCRTKREKSTVELYLSVASCLMFNFKERESPTLFRDALSRRSVPAFIWLIPV